MAPKDKSYCKHPGYMSQKPIKCHTYTYRMGFMSEMSVKKSKVLGIQPTYWNNAVRQCSGTTSICQGFIQTWSQNHLIVSFLSKEGAVQPCMHNNRRCMAEWGTQAV